MKRVLVILSVFFVPQIHQAQKVITLHSPDSALKLEISIDKALSYSLFANRKLLLSSDAIDLALSKGKSFSGGLKLKSKKTFLVNETVRPPLAYRRKTILDHYRSLLLSFKEPFSVEFRLYNNGMAYRIGTQFNDSVVIENETAAFNIDPNAEAWFSHIDKRIGLDKFHTSFEGVYKKEKLAAIADTMLTYAPLTIGLPSGYFIAISDAGLKDYPGMFLEKSGKGLQGVFASYPLAEEMTEGEFPQLVVRKREQFIARRKGSGKLPWRAILVGKNEVELAANDMLYLLGDAPSHKDFSWLRPAKGTDEWITGINLFNIPFEAGINTATYKYYIDFAKRFGFDQIMLDAGWSDVKDLFKINPALNMEELVAYAKEKNIRLMLWTLCSTLDRQLDSALKQFHKWGVHAIMTDFMDRDDQPTVAFYHRIAKTCAENEIAIMFHGAFPPKGFNRTWPNAITQEGVLGAEWNIWSELATPEHNVAIAYTRMLAGPLDYEPGLLLNAQKDQFKPIAKNPMSIGTRCHQLTMFVVYDSPLQIFSGNISQGLMEPEFMQLLGSLPATWDDTRILEGKIGEYIISLRKKDNDWYIAGLNNSVSRDILLSFEFLPEGNYTMTLCRDGVNAHHYGSDYAIEKKGVNRNTETGIHMAPGGGFVIHLKKSN